MSITPVQQITTQLLPHFPRDLQSQKRLVEEIVTTIEAHRGEWMKELPKSTDSFVSYGKQLVLNGRKYLLKDGVRLNNGDQVKIKAMVTSDGRIFLLFGKAKKSLGKGTFKKTQQSCFYNEKNSVAFLSPRSGDPKILEGLKK